MLKLPLLPAILSSESGKDYINASKGREVGESKAHG